MKGGRWLVLGLFILALFGGCTAMAGKVSPSWLPPFAAWVVVLVPCKLLNDRFRKVKWPMEFITWAAVLLIALNLVWLGVSRA